MIDIQIKGINLNNIYNVTYTIYSQHRGIGHRIMSYHKYPVEQDIFINIVIVHKNKYSVIFILSIL